MKGGDEPPFELDEIIKNFPLPDGKRVDRLDIYEEVCKVYF